MNNTAAWREELVIAIGNLNFAKFFKHAPAENDHYPAFIIDEVVDRFSPGDETNQVVSIERSTTIYIQVSAKDRNWDLAESRCFDLGCDTQKSINLHFGYSITWAKRRMYRAVVNAREVMICQLEFSRSLIETV